LNGWTEESDDVVGNWDNPNPLRIVKTNLVKPILTGSLVSYGRLVRSFENFPIDYNFTPASSEAYFDDPNLASLAQEAVGKTNPSGAHVSIPVFAAEMKDLPDLVRDMGYGVMMTLAERKAVRRKLAQLWFDRRSGIKPRAATQAVLGRLTVATIPQYLRDLVRGLAAGNLTWRFGIRTMQGDISRLIGFQEAVRKRFDYLKRLRDEKRHSRRVGSGLREEEVGPVTRTVQSRGAIITMAETTTYTEERWTTVTWQARWTAPNAEPVTDEALMAEARRLVVGFTDFEAIQAGWELIPWSWMSDWFTGYGNIIAALNNTVGAIPVEVCFMQWRRSRRAYKTLSKPGWVTIHGVPQSYESIKTRTIVPIGLVYTPIVSMPALGSGQWSILGSLGSLELLKGFK
jgi:hypothetical protein